MTGRGPVGIRTPTITSTTAAGFSEPLELEDWALRHMKTICTKLAPLLA